MPNTTTNTSTNGSTAISSFINEISRRSAYLTKSDLMLISVPTGINTCVSLLLGFPSEDAAFTGVMTAMTCGGIALLLSDKSTERNKATLQLHKAGYRAATIGSIVSGSITGVGVLTDLTDPQWLTIPVSLAANLGYAWYVAENKEQSAARATELGSIDARGWPQGGSMSNQGMLRTIIRVIYVHRSSK